MAVGMVSSPGESVGAWLRRNEENYFSVKPAVSEEWGAELTKGVRIGSGGLREVGEGGRKPRRKKRRQRNKGMWRVGIS